MLSLIVSNNFQITIQKLDKELAALVAHKLKVDHGMDTNIVEYQNYSHLGIITDIMECSMAFSKALSVIKHEHNKMYKDPKKEMGRFSYNEFFKNQEEH